MTSVRFALVAEGGAEGELVPHLRRLCVEAGASEVVGTFPDLGRLPNPPGRVVADKVRAVLALDDALDVIFVHKDADSPDGSAAREEIERGTRALPGNTFAVPVIPVQEFEAWLLVDEQAIREVAGKPRGRQGLEIPAHIETAARPKEILMRALEIASEAQGRRLDRLKRSFGAHRRTLVQRLDTQGAVRLLVGWQQLEADVTATIALLRGVDA